MAIKNNKILPFATNVEINDILDDDEYQGDVTRTGGNIVGIAKRRPNNKALKQATLIASALAELICRGTKEDGSKDDGYDVNDALPKDTIEQYLRNVFVNIVKDTAGDDDSLVHIENAETITGAKTFTSKIIANGGVQLPSTAPAGDNDAVRKGYIDNNFTLLPVDATTADANKFTTPQRLACPSTTANLPEVRTGFMDVYRAKSSNIITQVYYLINNSAIYARTSDNGGATWSEWKLQTVSDLSAYVKSVNQIKPDTLGNVNITIPNPIPAGSKVLFYQAAAPTGWTIDNSVNDVGVKIVNANGGTIGGSTAFSNIFGKAINTSSTTVTISGNTGGRAITVAQLAKHNHSLSIFGEQGSNGTNYTGHTKNYTDYTGSDQTHNHTFSGSSSHIHNITLNLKHVNVIICSKI